LISRCVPTRSVLQRPSTESDSEEEINPVRTPMRPARGPRLGIWKSTPGKPFVIMDDKKKILKVFGQTPISRRHTIAEDTRTNVNSPISQPILEMSPMISNSANLMMSAMYAPMDQFAGNVLGPPEAFFPFTSISPNGDLTQDSPSSYDDDDVDDENLWKLDDFLQFGPDSSDDEAADELCETHSTLEGEIGTPRPTTATSEEQSNPLLSNPALVGAFRSNQHRHKILSRNSNTTENSLLFSTSINSAAIRGIKKGRISAATAPIATPRKRAPRPVDLSSPSVGQGQKRKFSGENMGHKRTKSLN